MNTLWIVFSGRMNEKPKMGSLWRKPNLEDIMKMILKEYEDEGGCKGRGYVCDISRLTKNFKDQ